MREEDDEDSEGFDDLDAPGSDIEVPFDPTKIDITSKPMTIGSLEERFKGAGLDLSPDFQRQANLWDDKRKSRLIESILLKIPLPSFYFSEDSKGVYSVVDGLQRLCAFFHFKNVNLLNSRLKTSLKPLVLQDLQYLTDLNGKTFSDLDNKFQWRIAELEIAGNVIRANTPSAVKFNVFARLNQGGMPLNAQEIRNAIFPGRWREEVRKISESEAFLKATGRSIAKDRRQDSEVILRYFALLSLGRPYQRPSGQNLDEFLNQSVEHEIIHWDDAQWKRASTKIIRSLETAIEVFGRNAFRKSFGQSSRTPINRGLFESELIALSSISSTQIAELIKKKAKFEKMFLYESRNNYEFFKSLESGTGSAEASNSRVKALRKMIKDTLIK